MKDNWRTKTMNIQTKMRTALALVFLPLAALLPLGCPAEPEETAMYSVTFDANGGDEDTIILKVQSGSSIPGYQIPDDLYHYDEGLEFAGWNTRKSGAGNVFDEDTIITKSITVYAQWQEVICTVTFNPNGGTLYYADEESVQVKKGTSLGGIFPYKPYRSGYTFVEWNTMRSSNGDTFTKTTPVNSSFPVYAIWTAGGSVNPGDDFVAVSGITLTCATTVAVNTDLTLAGTVSPSNATNQTITWSFNSTGTTAAGAAITSGKLKATGDGVVKVLATVANGTAVGTNKTQEFTITVTAGGGGFVAVNSITLTCAATVAVNTDLTLAGTVSPTTATYQTITWSFNPSGTTAAGAAITSGKLKATGDGVVKVLATVANGTAVGTDKTQEFTITVTAGSPPAYNPAVDYTVTLPGGSVKNSTPITGTYDESGPKVVLDLPVGFAMSNYTKISIKAKFYDSSNAPLDYGTPDDGSKGYGKGQVKLLSDATKASYESPNPIDTIQNLNKQNGSTPSAGTVQCPIKTEWTVPAGILAQAGDNAVKYIEITEITFYK
jgi:hypothetical protein